MNESMDRELGQIQQKLESTSENIGTMRNDLGRLFQTIDKESKDHLREIARIGEKVNIHQTKDVKEKESIQVDIRELRDRVNQNIKDIDSEKDKRIIFETEIRAGVKFAKLLAGILGALASVISALAAVFVHLK